MRKPSIGVGLVPTGVIRLSVHQRHPSSDAHTCSEVDGTHDSREASTCSPPWRERAQLSDERANERGPIGRPAVCREHDLDRQVEQHLQAVCDLLARHACG